MHLNTYNFNVGSNFSFRILKNYSSKDRIKITIRLHQITQGMRSKGTTKKNGRIRKLSGKCSRDFYLIIIFPWIGKKIFYWKWTGGGIKNNLVCWPIDQYPGKHPLPKNWDIRLGNIGYDFKNHALTYPDFGVSRVLHCWKMTFDYQPLRGYLFI